MFCAKCGSQITEADKHCPKCGHENINYSPTTNEMNTNIRLPEKKQMMKIITVALICILVIGATFASLTVVKRLLHSVSIIKSDKVEYTQYGQNGYCDEGHVYFIDKGEMVSYEGDAEIARTTPDHSKYVMLMNDNNLKLYDPSNGVDLSMSGEADSISALNNDGCFFKNQKDHLYFYSFKDNKCFDTKISDRAYYSLNKNAVVGIDEDGLAKCFTVNSSDSIVLCNVDEEAIVCCVKNDGSNFVWAEKDGSIYDVFTLQNGAPERIGKIKNSEKYSSIKGYYYNDGKDFFVYSSGSTQIIKGHGDSAQEIALPGVKAYDDFINRNGMVIDSEDDVIKEPYLIVTKTKSADTGALYILKEDGTLNLEVDGIMRDPAFTYSDDYMYCLRNGVAYYIDSDGDLRAHKLGAEEDSVVITTDVTSIEASPGGKYVYVVKSGGLYYIDLKDKNHKLNSIANKITGADRIYLTGKDDTIFYITDMAEIKDTYYKKGTLYKFVVGNTSQYLANDMMFAYPNDNNFISGEYPMFQQYESNDEYDFKYNIGTCDGDTYKELIHSIKY